MMGSTEQAKVCTKCGRELHLSEFYKNVHAKDGYLCWCKECCKIHQRKYYNSSEEVRKKYTKYSRECSTFGREMKRGNCGISVRDYELTEEQLRKRNKAREYRKAKGRYNPMKNPYGILVWYDGKLDDLPTEEYDKAYKREYARQFNCAVRGSMGKIEPSEHFLFDFDLEHMLKCNAYYGTTKYKYHITKWWQGEIRHWNVKDGIWKDSMTKDEAKL